MEISWRNQRNGETEVGHTLPGSDQSGNFWFFNPAKLELVVKMLDGRGVNGKYWFFYGGLSDFEYTLSGTDTTTGAVKTYRNPPGKICGDADTAALRRSAEQEACRPQESALRHPPNPIQVPPLPKKQLKEYALAIVSKS